MRSFVRRGEELHLLAQEAPSADKDIAFCYAAITGVALCTVQILVVIQRPPSADADDIGRFIHLAYRVEDVRAGDRGIAVVRVLFGLYRCHETAVSEVHHRAIVTWIVREDVHAYRAPEIDSPCQICP